MRMAGPMGAGLTRSNNKDRRQQRLHVEQRSRKRTQAGDSKPH
jgi:hypothetical protein